MTKPTRTAIVAFERLCEARTQRYVRGALFVMGALGFLGCATVGPRSVNAGRGAYAEVINRTEDEQILNLIVRSRYDESFGMIAVSNVTASLSFRAQAGVDVGWGLEDSYSGRLVPFSAGVAYEENPTISYTPLDGAVFLRKMTSPVSLTQFVLLSHMSRPSGRTFEIMAGRVNGLRNPFIGLEQPSPEYSRLADLYTQLRLGAVMDIVHGETNDDGYFVDIHDYEDEYSDTVRDFLDLLGIESEIDGDDIVLPLRTAIGTSSTAINVRTRSPTDLLRVYGAGIDIPPPHLEAGIVQPVKWEVEEKWRPIAIRSSKKRPDEATVSILFHDWWFYIDVADPKSKKAFVLLRNFIGMVLEGSGKVQAAPVLTVPVR